MEDQTLGWVAVVVGAILVGCSLGRWRVGVGVKVWFSRGEFVSSVLRTSSWRVCSYRFQDGSLEFAFVVVAEVM